MPAGMSSAPLRRLHGPQSNWMFSTLFGSALAPRDDVVVVEVRGRAALAAPSAVPGSNGNLNVLGMDLVFRSPTGA
jgi:hypothetical protein